MDDNITQVIFDYNKIFTALNSKLENNSLEQATEVELIDTIRLLNELIDIAKLYPNKINSNIIEYAVAYIMYIHILLHNFVKAEANCKELLNIRELRVSRYSTDIFTEYASYEKHSISRLKELVDKFNASQGEMEALFELKSIRLIKLNLCDNLNLIPDIKFILVYLANKKDMELVNAINALEFLLQQNTDRDKKDFLLTQLKNYAKNDKIALFLLGLYYEQNKFKEVNFTQSAYYQLESAKRGFLLAIAKIGGYYYNVEHNLTSYLFWIYKALEHEGVHCEVQWKQIQQFISKYSLWGFIEETKKCAIQNAVIAQFILAKYYKIEFPNESVFWMEQFNNNPNGAEYVKREYKSMKASLPFDV